MASTQSFIEFVCDQIKGTGEITYKKMFGEYMIYVNAKPILLVCDNTVYIKMLNEIKEAMQNEETGEPYKGAKPHYILNVDNAEFSKKIVSILEPISSLPKKKKKK
jgi:TfoX/Sxy family transcriptional regulator of competence genes